MPRPGPRPYECIRRAWHSDTHQALRATIVQEIFRFVNEVHCSSTRNKKEWQEKLPIVALRAEEILYSKANSESEYVNVETLRTRLEDAVNTIIRREDSDETGSYLTPCVEAALALGCTPKRTPRGHRQPRQALKRSTCTSANPVNGVPGFGNAGVGMMQVSSSTSVLCPPGIGGQLGAPGQGRLSHSFVTPPSVCYVSDAIPRPNSTPVTPRLVSNVLVGPSLPNFGLQGFLRAPDASRQADYPAPGNAGPYTRMLTHLNQESQEVRNSRARMDLGFVCVNPQTSSIVRTCVPTISSVLSAGRYTKPPLQSGQSFGNIAAEGMDSVRFNLSGIPVDIHPHFQPQMSSRPLNNDQPSRVMSEWGGSPPSHRPRPQVREETAYVLAELPIQNTQPALASADNENASCPIDAHDLQLRLRPPGDQPVLSHKRTVLEHSPEGGSMSASWNNLENNLASGRNYSTPPQIHTCKKFDVDGCDQLRVPEPKRLRGDAAVADSFSSTCENMLQAGSTLPPEPFKWPRR